jgi:glutamyl-tRNA reductase
MDDVYLYNVDDLQHIAQDYLDQRKAELERCEQIIKDKVAGLLDTAGPPPGSRPQQTPALGT